MKQQSRREFLKTTGVMGAAFMAPAIGVMGANEEIRVAVCGVNSQGFSNAKGFHALDGVKVVALCDPDSDVLNKRIKDFAEEFDGDKVDGHEDYREVLDRDDVDAVVIATPNHWHVLMGIQACEAGKDAYVQKPLSHTVWEGQQMVAAAKKYDRIVQTGTQNRSDVGLLELYPWIAEGNLGKVKMIRGLCFKNRDGIGRSDKPVPPPKSMNYDLWLGPAQDQPIYRPNYHYDWHWDWNTGNGDIGNQGPHEMDLIRWAMGDKSNPDRVISWGGRFQWDDAGKTPNMQFAAFEYNGIPVLFEVRDIWLKPDVKSAANFLGTRTGVVITCEDGFFVGGRGGGWIYDNDGKKVRQFKGDGGKNHYANFIEAVRTRKKKVLRAPTTKGHRSAILSHIANISYRLGSEVTPGEMRELVSEDKNSVEALERFSDHLAEWNIDFEKEPWTAGVSLAFNPRKEIFTGKGELVDRANAMLTRKYRDGFVVPDLS